MLFIVCTTLGSVLITIMKGISLRGEGFENAQGISMTDHGPASL